MVFGSSSCNSASRLAPSCTPMSLMPVALPPGRLRLVTRPIFTGSAPMTNTMGIVDVAALAAQNLTQTLRVMGASSRSEGEHN